MEQNTNNKDLHLVSVREACKRLGIGSWSFYQLLNKNALKTVEIGRRRLVSTREIDSFINSMER